MGEARHRWYGSLSGLAWRWRLLGWAVVALPVGLLVGPWQVPIGLLAFELAVVALGSWMWRREAGRRVVPPPPPGGRLD